MLRRRRDLQIYQSSYAGASCHKCVSVSSSSKRLQLSDLKKDDYIFVRLTTESIENFHIGQILKVDEEEQEIHSTFMTRMKSHQAGNIFHFPELVDTSTHGRNDEVFLLPQPVCGTTLRTIWTF